MSAAALRTSHHTLPLLDSEFTAIAAELQATNLRSATELRLVMLSGLVIAARTRRARGRHAGRAAKAGKQPAPGAAADHRHSAHGQGRAVPARSEPDHRFGLFRAPWKRCSSARTSPALHSRACSRTSCRKRLLATALKFVKILWAERTNEKLVKTINPLGEVEVHLDSGNGKFDTRYLQFDFHRVRVDGEMTQVLVSVSDVSARVDLAQRAANLAEPGAGSGRYAARHSAHRSGAADLVLERLERRDENDQRGAARTDSRGRRIPQEARYAVPAGALGQGRGGGAWECPRSKAVRMPSRTT